MPDYAERVEAIILAWPQWSPAERRRMEEIVEEIMDHVRHGGGNAFVREWCKRNLNQE